MNKQLILTLTAMSAASSAMAMLSVNLPGLTEQSNWADMNGDNYTTEDGWNGYGTATAAWPEGISPDNGSAIFDKVSGGGYPASEAIYNAGIQGTYSISDSSPITGLETLVFQIDMGSYLVAEPTLSYNGGTQNLAATSSGTSPGNFVGMGAQSVIFGYQWDLTGLGAISDYVITWTSAEHSTNNAMQINTGDTFSAVAVPEPRTYALMAGLACGALILMRRQRR